jgi:lipid-A-disaccharide synthase
VILPFEEELFRREGADARFVGHPLLDVEPPPPDRDEFCRSLGIDPARRLLALFPGSRAQEVHRHLEPFTRAGALVRAALPSVQPVIAGGSSIRASAYAGVTFPVTDDAWALLHHAAAAIVKSGTSTLQAALALTPMVIAYRTSGLTYAIARRVVRVDHIGLANLVAGERVAPELVQDAVTGEALAAAVLPLLDVESRTRAKALEGLGRVRAALATEAGSGSVADHVANLAAELIGP